MDSKFESYIAPGIPFAEAASFYMSVKQAAATDPPDETGMLEGQFSAPVENALAAMLQQVKNEFETMYAYTVYAQTLRDLSHDGIASHFQEHADEELDHAEFLLKRIAVLGGPAHAPDLAAPHPSADPIDIIKTMIRMEQEGIAGWRAILGMVGNNPMKITIEDYMAVEQGHLDDLWQLLPHTARPAIIQQAPEMPKVAARLDTMGANDYDSEGLPIAKAGIGDVLGRGALGAGAGVGAATYTGGTYGGTAAPRALTGALSSALPMVGLTSETPNPISRGALIGGAGGIMGGALEGMGDNNSRLAYMLAHMGAGAINGGIQSKMKHNDLKGQSNRKALSLLLNSARDQDEVSSLYRNELMGQDKMGSSLGHTEDGPLFSVGASAHLDRSSSIRDMFTRAVARLTPGKPINQSSPHHPGIVLTMAVDPTGVRRGNDLQPKFMNGDLLDDGIKSASKEVLGMRMKLAFDQMMGNQVPEPAAPQAGPSPELQQYMQMEAGGIQAQHAQEVQYYQGQAQQSQQENSQLQEQLQQVQQQATELQQQVQQSQDQLNQMNQQSQQVQQVAMQSATQANQLAAQANIQQLQSQQDALMHKQLSTNMRAGVAEMKAQLAQSLQNVTQSLGEAQQAIMNDPTEGVEAQLGSGGPPPQMGMDPNMDPAMAGQDPNAQQQPGADPNAQQGAPAAKPKPKAPSKETEAKTAAFREYARDLAKNVAEVGGRAGRTALNTAKTTGPYAAAGAALFGAGQYLTHKPSDTDNLRQSIQQREAENPNPTFAQTMSIAQKKMKLLLSEAEDKHPIGAAAAAAATGASLGALLPTGIGAAKSLAAAVPRIRGRM